MQSMRWTLFGATAMAGALVLAGLSACATTSGSGVGPGSTASGSGSGPATGAVGVTVERTGGFAGVQQTLVVTPEGAWTYTDRRQPQPETGQFTPAQIAELARLAQDPRVAQELARPNTQVCNDAFEYAITIGTAKAMFEDCLEPRPAVSALLAFLMADTPL